MSEAQTIAGMSTRIVFCAVHQVDYVECFISGPDVWAGYCEKCAAEEKLSARADELLEERRAEKWQRVNAIMRKRAPEIEAEIEKAMLNERDQRMGEWRVHIEEPIRKKAEAQVEREMRREILDFLKTQEPSASAAGG
jgi:hypothetical protein